MKIVTINFAGGKYFNLTLPDDIAAKLIKGLTADINGTTHIDTNEGTYVVYRAQITYIEVV